MDQKNINEEFKNEIKVAKIADVLLIFGLISSIVLIIGGFAQYKEHYARPDDPINWDMITTGLSTALLSFSIWGVLIMLSNISRTLKSK